MRFLVLAVLLVALPAGAVTIDWVPVGDPGNAADTASNCLNSAADCGSVADAYRISKYEVTNAQYAEFLNAMAATDPFGLYNTSMGSDATGGITRSGCPGSYSYAVKSGLENKPVIYVSFYDALRFANWLHNGQPAGAQETGTTETGAYTITGADEQYGRAQRRAPCTFLPSENEWYKAAYYDPVRAGYFDYPTGTDIAPSSDGAAGRVELGQLLRPRLHAHRLDDLRERAHTDGRRRLRALGEPVRHASTRAGTCGSGTRPRSARSGGIRGGSWGAPASNLAASGPSSDDPTAEGHDDRVSCRESVPEPAQVLLVLTGGLVLAAVRKRRA